MSSLTALLNLKYHEMTYSYRPFHCSNVAEGTRFNISVNNDTTNISTKFRFNKIKSFYWFHQRCHGKCGRGFFTIKIFAYKMPVKHSEIAGSVAIILICMMLSHLSLRNVKGKGSVTWKKSGAVGELTWRVLIVFVKSF